MKSYKTTLGGSLSTLGKGLSGFGTLTALTQLNSTSATVTTLTFYFLVVGFVIDMFGQFFTSLWAADNTSVQRVLADHAEQIAQIKEETKPPFQQP